MGEKKMKWTLHVKNFGKIEEASIEVNKITIMNGENNSGKSYIMSLLYTLCNMPFYKIPYELKGVSANRWITKIQNMLTNEEIKYCLTLDDCMELNELFNIWLNDIKDYLLQKTFHYPITADTIEVSFCSDPKMMFHIKPKMSNDFVGIQSAWDFVFFIKEDTRTPLVYNLKNNEESIQVAIKFMFDIFLDKCLLIPRSGVMFLPTSRTGFMLTFKDLSSKALNDVYSLEGMEERKFLTKPSLDFLTFLAGLNKEVDSEQKDLANYIEHNLLQGHINVQTEPFINITYIPDGTNIELPLSVTSAVVTELAPLVVALRYAKCMAIFLEEPEMCLHPRLQWLLGKVLVKLSYNSPIILTTHSDILMQYFSNVIRLNYNPEKVELMKEHKYREEDLITKEEINVYQFVKEEKGTKIKKCDCTEDGIDISSFHHAFEEMYKETVLFTAEEL